MVLIFPVFDSQFSIAAPVFSIGLLKRLMLYK